MHTSLLRPSGALLHTLSKLYNVPISFVNSPPPPHLKKCIAFFTCTFAVGWLFSRYQIICLVCLNTKSYENDPQITLPQIRVKCIIPNINDLEDYGQDNMASLSKRMNSNYNDVSSYQI